MTTMTAVVAGVTGNQGGAVAKALVAKGWRVVGLTRSKKKEVSGVEMVEANLDDEASLVAALRVAGERVDGVFCVTNYWANGTKEKEVDQLKRLLRAAEAHGDVGLFAYSSTAGADPALRPGFDRKGALPDFDTRWACEQILRESSLPVLVVRPAQFAENFFGMLQETHVATDKAFGWPGFDPRSEVKHALVTLDDLGDLVEAAMRAPAAFAGKTLDVASVALTASEMLRAYEDAKGLPRGSVAPKGALPLWLLWFLAPAVYRLFRYFNAQDFPVDLADCATYMPTQTPFPDLLAAKVSGHAA